MKTVAAGENGAEMPRCFACAREIRDDHWFARIKLGDRRVLFCRPRCVEVFLEDQKGREAITGQAKQGSSSVRTLNG